MMVCEAPARSGTRFGQPARGTPAGYARHLKAGEEPCQECGKAHLEYNRDWRRRNLDRVLEQNRAWNERNKEKWDGIRRVSRMLGRAKSEARRIIEFSSEDLASRLSMFGGCWICGSDANQVDHVVPVAHGGMHCLSNLRPVCKSCNVKKGGLMPVVVSGRIYLRLPRSEVDA